MHFFLSLLDENSFFDARWGRTEALMHQNGVLYARTALAAILSMVVGSLLTLLVMRRGGGRRNQYKRIPG